MEITKSSLSPLKDLQMARLYFWGRRCAAIATTGMVFQASGCTVDNQELVATLFSTILQNLVGTFVFGAFNLVP
jgi:hypothetical protein